jgi:small multidrug resistance family-3 protein
MALVRSVLLFVVTAAAELSGVWLLWRAVRAGGGAATGVAGACLLVAYGILATLQPDGHFGRVLAAYGGVFVAGSLLWGVLLDGFRPARHDLIGAALCLVGMAVIMGGKAR